MSPSSENIRTEMPRVYPQEVHYILRPAWASLYVPVQNILRKVEGSVLAGGYLRSFYHKEPPRDIDLFFWTPQDATLAAYELAGYDPTRGYGTQTMVTTPNAITVVLDDGVNVQCILKESPRRVPDLLDTFDFTMSQAAIWWDSVTNDVGIYASPNWLFDVADKRLRYLSPCRDEAPGGSITRCIKFLQKGWRLAPDSLDLLLEQFLVKSLPRLAGFETLSSKERLKVVRSLMKTTSGCEFSTE